MALRVVGLNIRRRAGAIGTQNEHHDWHADADGLPAGPRRRAVLAVQADRAEGLQVASLQMLPVWDGAVVRTHDRSLQL